MKVCLSITSLTWRKTGPAPEREVKAGWSSSTSFLSVQVRPALLRLDWSLHSDSLTRGCLEASLVATPVLGKSVRKMRISVAEAGKVVRRLLSLELMNSVISFDRMFPAFSNQISRQNFASILPQ